MTNNSTVKYEESAYPLILQDFELKKKEWVRAYPHTKGIH